MKLKGVFPLGLGSLSRKQLLIAPALALLCALATGCPHNEYTVELKPQAGALERTLTFYRVDGTDSNGMPKYLEFPGNELASITRLYPASAVRREGEQFKAGGKFSGAMPVDVGGSGSFLCLTNSLGEAGFYLERFRGNDNIAARTTKQFAAADQITDLVIGWARGEFSHGRGWKNLRKFLDEEFRCDLKNAGLYLWAGKVSALSNTNTSEEFAARFGQYLLERGYFTPADLPGLYQGLKNEDGDKLLRHLKRLTAEKLHLPAGELKPKSPGLFGQIAVLEQSWTNYLAKTSLYRAQIKKWEHDKKADPKLERPQPEKAMDGLISEMLGNFSSGGEADHLTVKLALGRPPEHSNGKWQDGQVVWDVLLEPDRALPVVCYANWSTPATAFQQAHFRRVLLDGNELTEYCLWQNALTKSEAAEWNQFLSALQPDADALAKIKAFRFSTEPVVAPDKKKTAELKPGPRLLAAALEPGANSK